MPVVTIQIEGMEDCRRVLQAAVLPPIVATRIMAGVMYTSVQLRFRESRGPGGQPWKPSRRVLAEGGLTLVKNASSGLRASIVQAYDEQAAAAGTNKEKYPAIHQFGGFIVPKKGKALAIPLTKAAEDAGSPRRFPRPLDLVWPKGQAYGWLVEYQAGSNRRPRAREIQHYLLVRQVEIPARPYLGFDDKDREELLSRLAEKIRQQMKDAR